MYAHRLMAAALLAALAVTPAFGETLTVNNNNSAVSVYRESSTLGYVNSWNVDGVEQVFQVAWLYSVSSGSSAVVVPTGMTQAGNVISATFDDAANNLHVDLAYTLNGGAAGTRASQLSQAAVFKNNSASPLSLHVFAYADLDVGGTNLNNNVSISGSTATQTGPDGWKVTETVSGPSNVRMVGDASDTALSVAGKILSTTPPNLIESPGPLSNVDADYGFQWNLTVGAGEAVTLTRIASVPEPASLAMLAGLLVMGGPVVLLLRNRKRHA